MSNYTKTTNFAAKDSLPSGNAAKIVKGAEIDTEFNNIATASATKANANNAALTGTTVFETLSDGTLSITGWVDEDNMSSDSASLVPTQQSVKAYVDSQVTAQDLDVTDGSTSIDIDLDSESLGILGGTGIDSTASGTGVTLAIDATVATLAGTQTLSNKTLSTPVVSGNLTTDGLLDGRDVATDGAKLDGIESGATADQTAAEIKTAYESNSDTNAFTDADESKLDGIEASADVTDTANVTAAGALMDSELTSEASVKALNQGVATTDSPTFAGVTAPVTGNVTGNLTGNVTGNVTGNLTGDVTGDVTGDLTGSVLTAAQTNITSVGNLTSLQVIDGDFNVLASEGGGAAESLLIADVSTKRVGVNKASPSVSLDIGSNTDAMHVPVGTTAQRPGSPAAGYFRYNSTTGGFEGYTDAWGAIAGGGGGVAPSIDTMTGDGSDTTLALTNAPVNENATFVTIDGVTQHKSTYSVSGTTLTFSTAPPTGSAVEAITLNTTTINTASILQDADGDTKVQVEESSDEDKIRFDTAGTERAVIDSSGLDVTGTVTADGLAVDGTATITTADNTTQLTLKSTDEDASIGPVLDLNRDSASPAVNDNLGIVRFRGDNSAGTSTNYAFINSFIGDATDGAEDGILRIETRVGGASKERITMKSTETVINDNSVDLNFRIESDNNSNALFVQGSDGNVGIGTSSPIVAGSDFTGLAIDGTASSITLTNGSDQTAYIYNSASEGHLSFEMVGDMRFRPGSAERARITSAGDLLVGTTTGSGTTGTYNGFGANAGGNIFSSSTGRSIFARRSTDGSIIDFRRDGTTIGSISVENSLLNIGSGDVGIHFDSTNDFIIPWNMTTNATRDNAIDLGSSNYRWDDIYATNGTIQTSDRNEKQDIEALSDAEQRVAVAAKGLLRKFRWISSVEENGDDARIHFGIIAQDLQDAFTAEGLDAGRYAMFISSTWTDEETGEERTRLGVRYSELLAFIISAI